MKKILLLLFFTLIFPIASFARENVDYWYIKDFQSNITVNKDSTATIEERITADCGRAKDKHGIFRTLPAQVQKKADETIQTPIELISITDFDNTSLDYSQSYDDKNHTLTWKIGDPNKTVKGVNYYKIIYRVKNIIRFDNPNFDEFYWNLSGNFWDLEIDRFAANVIFPAEATKENGQIDYYSGAFGSKDKSLAIYDWVNANTLEIKSTGTLKKGEGITLSASFPKNIFTPYIVTADDLLYSKPDWKEDFPQLVIAINILSILIPLLALILGFRVWSKYGKDIKTHRVIVPEFGIPDGMPPVEMGLVYSNGKMKNHYVSAGIINLAVKGFLKIEKVAKKSIFSKDDIKLVKLKDDISGLARSEHSLMKKLFGTQKEIMLSSLSQVFYTEVEVIAGGVRDSLSSKNLIDKKGYSMRTVFWVLSFFCLASSIGLGLLVLSGAFLSFFIASLILLIFGFIMPRRTLKGLELYNKILGFKLYMETAEKYRQQFNEKENIFEKFLPYAILFGITGIWIKKMKALYGQKYFENYSPVWYAGGLSHFDADSLNSAIGSVSSSMAATMTSNPSSSGSGGGGFSGGGGGGGGGGGW